MEEKVEYLPLGSVVIINGGVHKYLIVARGLQVDINNNKCFFDYGAVHYPEGMEGDKIMYFQHADINKVIFKGYTDGENDLMVHNIQLQYEKLGLTHVDTIKVKNRMEKTDE